MLDYVKSVLLSILNLNIAHVGQHLLSPQLYVELLLPNVIIRVIRKWIVSMFARNYAITASVAAMKKYL